MPGLSSGGLAAMVSHKIMEEYLSVKPGEQVLILADTETESDFVHGLAGAANALGADGNVLIQPPSFIDDLERPLSRVALAALEGADIFIPMTATTGHSVHDMNVARLFIAEKKMRMYVSGGWHGGNVTAALNAIRNHDYHVVTDINTKLSKVLNDGNEIHVTSEAGTDLHASIKDIGYYIDAGYAPVPGTVCNLPAGEAWGGPVEFTAEGKIAVDGAIAMDIGTKAVNPNPVMLTCKKGRVVNVEGGVEAERLRQLIENHKDADVLAEISIGTNPYIRLNGDCNHNDKKMYGTVHVALGHNAFQIYPHGSIHTDVHLDMVLIRPTVVVDGQTIVSNGQPLGMIPRTD